MRRAVILSVMIEGRSQETARLYGVSEAFVSRLLARYRAEGDTAFEPRSRRPHTSPTRSSIEHCPLVVPATAVRKVPARRGRHLRVSARKREPCEADEFAGRSSLPETDAPEAQHLLVAGVWAGTSAAQRGCASGSRRRPSHRVRCSSLAAQGHYGLVVGDLARSNFARG